MLATCYVLIVLLHLNPRLPLAPARLAPLVESVGLFYVVHLIVLFYTLLVARQLLARELFSPAWISVGVLAWLGAVAAAAGSALMWANLSTFTLVLARNGHRLRRIEGEPIIWKWMFWADGRQVAYETGPLHFGMSCVLADVKT